MKLLKTPVQLDGEATNATHLLNVMKPVRRDIRNSLSFGELRLICIGGRLTLSWSAEPDGNDDIRCVVDGPDMLRTCLGAHYVPSAGFSDVFIHDAFQYLLNTVNDLLADEDYVDEDEDEDENPPVKKNKSRFSR